MSSSVGVTGVGDALDPGARTVECATRVAVTALFCTAPAIRASVPGVNWAAVAGDFLLPNFVVGVMVTVSVWPAFVRTVHVEPVSLTIVTRVPLLARFPAAEPAVGVEEVLGGAAAACVPAEPSAATATPTPDPIASTATAAAINGTRRRRIHDRGSGFLDCESGS